mmetsp:Transcript_9940/g.27037  ORF Transcript_9940/g.27037 Transcript_9940/m.27037 type:complete len:437 (+) Transcript_9940:117-1427(+)|eukprot:CAMPEP_0202345798 /NCGR_PEP_ID=MMETSP1126-20121109/4876_1 /ASSEMBLY_ACC=CAM_ASM_000457 /TAXON_ID=3047 /ORGANISM="Dunaliella tertiolecta, Strain CCMP1320" /LENGTH=436 /DNA_ID=CAMNT_0048937141 /DNA_START=84 /DNA_END=1394 /DNA_ORIENTATION=-
MPSAEELGQPQQQNPSSPGSCGSSQLDSSKANGIANQEVNKPSSSTSANGAYRLHNRGCSNAAIVAASPFFHKEQDEAGLLPKAKLNELLETLGLTSMSSDTTEVVSVVAGDADGLTFDQTMAIVSMLQSSLLARESSFSSSKLDSSPSQSTLNMPLRRVLKTGYMTTGNVDQKDGAVISYLHKLQEHRRVCVEDGRYEEAKATAERLASLRTQQVERLRQGLVANQARELEDVHKVFSEESTKLAKLWRGRVKEYERSFARSVEEFRALHQEQQQVLIDQMHTKVQNPRPSKTYLHQRQFEGRLAKAQEYTRAAKVRLAAHLRRQEDEQEAQLLHEADCTVRLAKLTAKQQVEMEALLQRGARGRDELEIKRLSEFEKKTLRFKNVIMELQSLHKLEMVQLENFLDGQVQAGKAVPLRDGEAYRRRRDALSNTVV